jgi:hypothetical protein
MADDGRASVVRLSPDRDHAHPTTEPKAEASSELAWARRLLEQPLGSEQGRSQLKEEVDPGLGGGLTQ